jgi:hypothetical protein
LADNLVLFAVHDEKSHPLTAEEELQGFRDIAEGEPRVRALSRSMVRAISAC